MNTTEHDDRDGRKVWLSNDEVELLLETASGPSQRLAFALAARCGLRSEEVTRVTDNDVVDTDAGPMLLVHEGKGDKYRETPIPASLKNTIETAAEYRAESDSHPIVTSQSSQVGVTTRTLRRWIGTAREELAESEDPRWSYLTMHDLRRTWATSLKGAEVDALLVCDWGGWEDLETFLDAYRGTFSPDVQAREREKVGWL
ncbi:integrase family protein [Haloarcula vallismortis ATCC 29715]|uniref:Integrase family protein n=1 Tax=Haloarcula vallismortis ATCC 29715 TaxID=662477 RepID=M0IYJ4_HALVA|nr:site-specific integrase [Haloarcula vallismortis]EMA01806.1 integrase family protein [Haloarcula vallismortis ATCC 29715]